MNSRTQPIGGGLSPCEFGGRIVKPYHNRRVCNEMRGRALDADCSVLGQSVDSGRSTEVCEVQFKFRGNTNSVRSYLDTLINPRVSSRMGKFLTS
jgi:hypothetical protein